MQVLLIGATGFAGRHFATRAADAGLGLVTASRGGEADMGADLLDPGSLREALARARPDAVVNLAGAASVAASHAEPALTFAVNTLGPLNLLEAIRTEAPGAQVLCISSGEVYGAPREEQLPADEATAVAPLTPYGASKAAMELICASYARAGLKVAVVRAFNHLGPGQADSFVASAFARQVAEGERSGGEEIVLRAGNLSPARDFTDVRDMVGAYVAVLERGLTGTFNACSERPRKVRDLIDHLQAAASLPIRVETDESRLRPVDVPVLYGSSQRLRAETGWRAEIPLEKTLADLLEWWRARLAAP